MINVTPCAGVWIEIKKVREFIFPTSVTPCAGVWIEIAKIYRTRSEQTMSLPGRECGLKSHLAVDWCLGASHSLCGSVD